MYAIEHLCNHRLFILMLTSLRLFVVAPILKSESPTLVLDEDKPFRLYIIAGEPSGDALAVSFVQELRNQLGKRPLIISGVGHHAVNEQSLFPMSDIAVMGFSAVIQRMPLILRRIRETAAAALDFKPDLILSVDSPDFSLRVLKKVRARAPNIRLVHWVCPSVWEIGRAHV